MTFYDLGLSTDALDVSVPDEIISFVCAIFLFCFTIYLLFNLKDLDLDLEYRLGRFGCLSKILTFSIFAISAAATIAFASNTIYIIDKTAPNTIVERRYALDRGTRTVEVKDDFKTVYKNDQDVSFSSQIDNDFYQKLPKDLKYAIGSHVHFSFRSFESSHDKDVNLFSTDSDLTSIQIDILKELSKFKQVIEINASKDDSSVKILATIDAIEISKEDENDSNLEYHIDKIEIANAVETISRDDQSKSRDIKTVKIYISGKTSKAAKDKQLIEKLVE